MGAFNCLTKLNGRRFLGDGFMNTFQLIAFLLSIFNIAALMVSNANHNNMNDNINDNQVNTFYSRKFGADYLGRVAS